jgi:hypothetical protein
MGLVDDIVHRAARDARTDVRKMILPGLLVLAAGLSGAAGMGFLTAWAYLALTAAIGHGPAALLIGLGHALLSAGLVFVARRVFSKPAPDDASQKSPGVNGNEAGDAVCQIAFTAAFVLARYLGEKKQDG